MTYIPGVETLSISCFNCPLSGVLTPLAGAFDTLTSLTSLEINLGDIGLDSAGLT